MNIKRTIKRGEEPKNEMMRWNSLRGWIEVRTATGWLPIDGKDRVRNRINEYKKISNGKIIT